MVMKNDANFFVSFSFFQTPLGLAINTFPLKTVFKRPSGRGPRARTCSCPPGPPGSSLGLVNESQPTSYHCNSFSSLVFSSAVVSVSAVSVEPMKTMPP